MSPEKKASARLARSGGLRAAASGKLKGFLELSLIQKMAVALLAMGIVPLLVVSYRLVGLNRDAMTEQILRTHAVAARTAADRVEAFVDERRALAETVATIPELSVNPRSEIARELIAGILQARVDVLAIAITNPDGEEFIRAQRRDATDALDAVIAENQPQGLGAYRGESGLWIRVDASLPGDTGLVRLVADGSALTRVLHPDEIGEQADLVLADEQLEVVLGSLSDLSTFPVALVDLAASGRVSGANRFDADSEDAVLAAHAPVGGTSWFVLSRQPASVAEALGRSTIRQSLLAVILALVLAGSISAVAFRYVVLPVRNLARAQRRLAGMRDTQPVGNEISELQETFTMLERRMQDQDAIGTVFLGRYQIMGGLGAGMMGTVYRGWDPKLQRPVALKTVRLGEIAGGFEPNNLAWSLRNEAVTVAQFSHPHIVAIFDLEEVGDTAFIAMELVDGTDLQTYLRGGKLPYTKVVPIAAAVAKALAAAHQRGIVHHDIKPGNVLLGKDGAIKVSDFGISQLVASEAEESNFVFGTPGYLAPEALRGEGYDEKSDLFSLGVLMYRCLTAKRPFYGSNVESTIASTMEGDVVPPHRIDARIPEELSALVMSLIARDPANRPESADAVAEQLSEMALSGGLTWSPAREEIDANQDRDGDVPHVCFLPTEAVDTSRSGSAPKV